MKLKLLSKLTVIILFLFSSITTAQTTLNAGDIAILMLKTRGVDDFAFVTFVDIDPGTVIYFTDCGADASGFSTPCTEGAFSYTVPSSGLDEGDIIQFTDNPSMFVTYNDSRITGPALLLSTIGDQLIAFQDAFSPGGSFDAANNPRFIFINNVESTIFSGDKTDSNETGMPLGLNDIGSSRTALGLGAGPGPGDEFDIAIYNGTYDFTTGGIVAAKLAFSNLSNYYQTNIEDVTYLNAFNSIPASLTLATSCASTDNTPPVPDASTLPNVLAQCEVTSLTSPTATDNCAGTVTITNDASLPITNQGTTMVTWTYDDGNGNTSTQMQNVIIDDVTAPVINCPINISSNSSIVNFTNLTSTDNCDTIPFGGFASNEPLAGLTYLGFFGGKNLYVSDNTFTGPAAFADAQSRGGHLVTITDATLNSQIVTALNGMGIVNAYIGYSDTASEGNFVWQDGSNSTYQNFSAGEPNNSGTGEDYVHIRDIAGQWNDTGNPNFVYVYQSPNARFYQSDGLASGASYPLGTTTNTFVVTDASGNTSTCSFDVVVTDNTAPVANVANLPDVTEECEITTLTAPTATDDFAGTVTGTTTTTLPITAQGTTVVTWTYDDGNGNTAIQTQNVIINDVTAPVITCPANVSGTTPVITYPAVIANDNCDGALNPITGMTYIGFRDGKNLFISDSSFSGAAAFADAVSKGGTVVTITDAAFNAYISSQLVAQSVGEAHIGYSDALNEGMFVWQDGSTTTYTNFRANEPNDTDGVEDYVTISSGGTWNDVGARGTGNAPYILQISDGLLIQTAGFASGDVFPLGTTTNTFVAYDSAGNTNTCSFEVVVTDTTAPVPDLANLADVTVECEVNSLTAPTATDDFAGTLNGTTNATLPITTQGTTVITWTYDDGNGNTSTQTQNVIIDDVTAPGTGLPPTTLNTVPGLNGGNGSEGIVFQLVSSQSIDISAFNIALQTRNQDLQIWYTNSDLNGPPSIRTTNGWILHETINATGLSSGLTPTLQELTLTTPLTLATGTYRIFIGCPNCTVLYTTFNSTNPDNFTDGVITINTGTNIGYGGSNPSPSFHPRQFNGGVIYGGVNGAPFSPLPDVTAECEVISINAPTAGDNCAGMVTATTNTIFPITSQGTTVVTWNYDDGNGNTSVQTQNVIIDDVTAPILTLIGDAVVTIPEGSTFTDPGVNATDNCDVNLTDLIIAGDTVDVNTPGTYTITYNIDDVNGNPATQITRTVIIDALPTLPTVSISSNNMNSAFAKAGDVITLTFIASEDLQATPAVTIAGQTANVTQGATAQDWTATYLIPTIAVLDQTILPDAIVDFSINYQDLNGYSGTTITSTTDNTTVTVRRSPPVANTQDITVTLDQSGNAVISTQDVDNGSISLIGMNYEDAVFNMQIDGTQNKLFYNRGFLGLNGSGEPVKLVPATTADDKVRSGDVLYVQTIATRFGEPTGRNIYYRQSANDVIWDFNNSAFRNARMRLVISQPNTTSGEFIDFSREFNLQFEINNNFINHRSGNSSLSTAPMDYIIDLISGNPGFEDANSGLTLSLDQTTFNCSDIGANMVTLTATDIASNVGTATATVFVVDNLPPVPDLTMLNNVTTECEVTSLTAPTATDNCAGTVTATNNVTLPITTQGITVVIWTYDDGNGNISTQTQNVIIDDLTAPVADVAILADVTAECEVISLTAPTATDNCGGTVTVTSDAILPITNQGTTVVTWTYDDGNGNTSTQTQNVVIDDVTAPVLDAASLNDLVFNCEVTSLTAPTATDNCVGTVTATTAFPITSTSVITWTFDDGNGNSTTQNQLIIIERRAIDPIADVAECDSYSLPTITGDFLTGGQMYYTQSGGNGTAFAEADVINFADFTTYPVTIYAYDVDNATVCSTETSFELTLTETPIINPIADVNACDQYTLPALTVGNYYSFPGGNGTLINAGAVIGTTQTIFVYAEDVSGNCTEEISFTVNITPLDDASFSYDATTYCPNSTDPTAIVTGLSGGVFTSTVGLVIDSTTGTIDLDASNQGTYAVTYTTNGSCPVSSVVTVTIEDVIAPVPDLSVLADVTADCQVTTLVAPTATDNCNGTVTVTNDAVFPITGEATTTVVTWTYDDGNGNTSTQTQNVIIDDVTAPVADAAMLADVTAECEVTTLVAPTATDNCSSTVTVTSDAIFPITGEASTTVVTWTFDDGNGNTSTQTQNVIIDDVTAPVADAAMLVDVIAECEVTSLIAPTATDNCSGTVMVTNDAVFPITGEGTTTIVTWTYDDGNGNTSTQTQNVILDDITAPVADAAMLADVTAECEVTSLIAPTASDNCNGTVTATNDAVFPITGEGTSTVITWTYDDGNGNTSIQTQSVIIDDVTAPVGDVPTLADVLAECEVTTLIPPTATDNCNGTVTVTNDAVFPITGEGTTTLVTWTYDDGNGNTSTQTQNVIIDDVTAPSPNVTALSNLIFNCEVSSLTAPTASDNCAGSITGVTTASFPIASTTSITWTYDDGNGNISSQDQLVVIERRSIDAIADVAECDSFTLPAITGDFLTGGQMYYTQSGGNGNAFAEADIINFSDFNSYPVTLYAYDVDLATGCSAETSFELTINESPIIGSISDVSSCEQYELPVLTVGNYFTFPGGNGTLLAAGTIIDSTQTIFVYAEDASGNCSDETSFVVTINPTDLLGATFNDDTFTYDGSVQSLSVENIPSTATVVYTNNDQTEAGTYVVTATITSATASCSELVLTATMTIDRAPQTITFDPIQRRRLNVDPDFQLNASSSAGLPINYNFSFTGANPAATVSSTGFVNLLAEGQILIFASQPGNANYLPANTVQQFLEVYLGDNADLDSITIDGNLINNPGDDIYYLIECASGIDSVDVILENSDLATFDPGMTFTIATPRPGIYRQQIVITADNGRDTRVYNLTVERRFEFDDIVEMKYNNTLIVNNNFDNNGGYSFVAYEWFKNGRLVSTEQFFSEGDNASDLLDPTAAYYVRMTTTTGEVLQTCISTINLGNAFSLTVLENPVIEGRLLKVRADYPVVELENAMYQLYSASGQFIMEVPVQGYDSEINLSESLPVGMYRLVLITSQRKESVNFIKN